MSEPIAAEIIEAAVQVSGTAFHWKSALKTLFLNAGVPVALWDASDPNVASKFVIARRILDALAQRGDEGRRTQYAVITQLASLARPETKAPDPVAGARSIADLRRLALEHRLLVDPVAAERERKRTEAATARAAHADRRAAMQTLGSRFSDLVAMPAEQAQARGYDLERLLADLFAMYEIEYRASFRNPGEQLDGAFTYRAFTYLIEARWRALPPTWGDLVEFKAKVDAKLESTRGLFVSIAEFDEAAVERFAGMVVGSRRNTILVSGQDLYLVLDGRLSLTDALDYKITKASHEGRLWAPLVEVL